MAWDGLKKRFGAKPISEGRAVEPGAEPRSQPRWVAADQNPFGVAILDLTPVTRDLTAWSSDPVCASNAVSFGGDDGSTFVGVLPHEPTSVALDLRYPTDNVLADGPLFLPSHMEQKWALFLRDGKLIFVRSWRREVVAIADVSVANGEAILSRLTGSVAGGAKLRPERVVDFLVRTHVLGDPFPAPIDTAEGRDLTQLAHECFSLFGRFATCATPHEVPHRPPRRPLRSYSLLHLAIARGDIEAAARHVASGVPIDLLAADGLTPLHWASVCTDGVALEWLLEHGAQVDAPSAEGATPLMNAVQAGRTAHVERLLAHGADPSAKDLRGFTALHRAAEMGEVAIVRALVARGADPGAEAGGQTPIAFARSRGHAEVLRILEHQQD